MGLEKTVSAERLHIGFFGMRNAGKSSLVNAVTGQQLSVVSEVKGTTTDPVQKAMELLPLGAVVVIDTPGLDDEGELGRLRVEKTEQMIRRTDIGVLVADAGIGLSRQDKELLKHLRQRKIPCLVVYNKADLLTERPAFEEKGIYTSARTGEGIKELKEALGRCTHLSEPKVLVADLLEPKDVVVLVTPIDESAPRGRLILPQQLVIRDILDAHGIVLTCQDKELEETLAGLKKPPKLVITDSQVFEAVAGILPKELPLTSFSILMARYKGELEEQIKGAAALEGLKEGDKVLIAEGCTHHRQCNDIGTVKMPRFIENYTGIKPDFSFTSGMEFPSELKAYSLVVHCGGCMLNEAEMKSRVELCVKAGVPIVNYGIAIAKMHGILERSLQVFCGADIGNEVFRKP